jgi:hypothetical protein
MARERKILAVDEGVLPAAQPSAAVPFPARLAPAKVPTKHREQILALVRALARDAARSDHAADLPISRIPKTSRL